MRNKIIILDNNDITRKALTNILCQEYNIVEVQSRDHALVVLKQSETEIAAILIDMFLSQNDGFAFLKFLQENSWDTQIPVIAVCSSTSVVTEKKLFSYGVAECIRQPFDDTLIKIKINNIVKLFQYQNELKETIRQQTERLEMQNRMLRIQAGFFKKSNLKIIDLLGTMAEYRNLESSQHIQRVKTYTQIIADVYDALVNERVYKAAIPKEQAFFMIQNGECGIFSPELIQCLTNCREAIEAV